MVTKTSDKAAKSNTSPAKRAPIPTTMEELLAATGYNIPTLRRGQEVRGQIVSIGPSEILVEIGAKSEGIVTGRELSSVGDIASKLSVGDTLDAVVVSPENDTGQVVLSLRKLSGERRWQELEDKLKNKGEVEVVVLEVNRGGLICEWSGLRGFLPASQLLSQAASSDGQVITTKLEQLIGKKLSVQPLEVDKSTNRLIFTQKQRDVRDLSAILRLFSKIKIGQKFSGIVTAVLPFGVFVEINVGGKEGKEDSEDQEGKKKKVPSKLEGLVHISEISWEKVDDPAKIFKVGDAIDVMVTAKDEQTGRLNLSIKQLLSDPFMVASSKYTKDQEVSGKVSRVTPYGVFVQIDASEAGAASSSVEGLVHISKIPPNVSYKEGDVVNCLIEGVDTRLRRISLVPVVKEKPVLYR